MTTQKQPTMSVVDFAWQVIDMQRKIDEQDRQILRLRKIEEDYNELLGSTLRHSQVMTGNMLRLFITPGVVEACAKENTFVASTGEVAPE